MLDLKFYCFFVYELSWVELFYWLMLKGLDISFKNWESCIIVYNIIIINVSVI